MMRLVKNMLELCLAIFLVGCSSFQPELELGVYYKRDMHASITGLGDFKGVTTAPVSDHYEVVLEPKGDIEYIIIRSCDREDTYEHDQKKFLNIWKIGDNQFKYDYKPNFIEKNRICPLRIDSFDRGNKQHSWLFLDFEHPEYNLDYYAWCNGRIDSYHGVGACQMRAGLVAALQFEEEIQFAPVMDECPMPEKMIDKPYGYELVVALRECLYHFRDSLNNIGRITFIGYEGIKVEGK